MTPSKGRTIGFLCDGIHGDWSFRTWEGLRAAGRPSETHFVMLDGGPLGSPFNLEATRNRVYRLASPSNVDAVVMWKAPLAFQLTDPEWQQFVDQIDVPIVLIEAQGDLLPSVEVDNEAGVDLLFQHILRRHGSCPVGFLGLHQHHRGFQARYQYFLEGAQKYGMTLVPAAIKPYLEPGTEQLDGAFGLEQARSWLVPALEAGVKVLFCVADWIASQLILVLQQLGLRVPQDVAIVGFDDSRHSSLIDPPLTTITVPWEEVGKQAFRLVEALLNREPVPSRTKVPVHLVVRESCGCHFLESQRSLSPMWDNPGPVEPRLSAVAVRYGLSNPTQLSQDLVHTWTSIDNTGNQPFLESLERHLANTVRCQDFLLAWQHVLNVLFLEKSTQRTVFGEVELEARTLLAHYGDRSTGLRFYSTGKLYQRQMDLNLDLIAVQDYTTLEAALGRNLPLLGIPCWFLVRTSAAQSSHILMASGGPRLEFKPLLVLPEAAKRDLLVSSWIVQALSVPGFDFGYLVYAAGSSNDMELTTITRHVARALQVIEEKRTSEARAQELIESHIKLDATTRRMIQVEKIAALGTLVRGLAHQMNTPLGTILTASSFQQESLRALRSEVETLTLDKTRLLAPLSSVEDTSYLTFTCAQKAGELIQRLLYLSDQAGSLPLVDLPLFDFFMVTLKPYKNIAHSTQIEWRLAIPPDTRVFCYPDVLNQILSNLVSNTLVHGFRGRTEGTITVAVSLNAQTWTMVYEDNGCGLSYEDWGNLFVPFQSAMKSTGPGLGSFITYSLVTQQLKGTIRAFEPAGGGLGYEIKLPILGDN